jgi:two-component system chemotaxis response regulator CheB
MPSSAVRQVEVDHILPLSLIGAALTELVQEEINDDLPSVSEEMTMETDISEFSRATTGAHAGNASGYTCPECHGALFEIHEGEIVRYRCRVGHAFSPISLLGEQASSLEGALWVALRALEESASLARRVAERARGQHHDLPAERFEERAREAENSALVIREVLLHNRDLASAGESPGVNLEEHHPGYSTE